MKVLDGAKFALGSVHRAPLRTALMLLAMAIGVVAVVMLSALGNAAKDYVVAEFSSLGTNLVIVLPGRSETTGGTLTASYGGTNRPLTIEDAEALTRGYHVTRVAPIIVGAAGVQHGGLEREAPIFGGTHEMQAIRHWQMARGQFLPAANWQRTTAVCVIGLTIAEELFGEVDPVGQWLRVGENRFRVIGVLANTGRSLGIDVDEVVVVPVASAMRLFNRDSLFRILLEASSRSSVTSVRDFAEATLAERHHGERDVTVITQDAVLDTFDEIFNLMTLAVLGIASVSLLVAGLLIMNVMLVAVAQRTAEVGVLKALGASAGKVVQLFLLEAVLLSAIGAAVGVLIGMTGTWLLGLINPALDGPIPLWAILAAIFVALSTGVLFGVTPARRAARLDPIAALNEH